ncbi:hypothetical protein KKC94_00155 [Patescibacteria group bacterium]|nr:hypothetical protein [Patescibacteria group bacterium]
MEKTLNNLAEISFYFFLITGLLHISSSLLIAEGVIDRADFILFNSMDLPFLFAGLIYMTSKLSLGMGEIFGSVKIPLLILSVFSLATFGLALFLNFGLADATLI